MNSNLMTTKTRQTQFRRVAAVALLMLFIMSAFAVFGVEAAFALPGGGGGGGGVALDGVMDIVLGIVKQASRYIGIIIVIWGVFQIVLAFRREDSEGISKQITTIVVGGVLAGFSFIIDQLYAAL